MDGSSDAQNGCPSSAAKEQQQDDRDCEAEAELAAVVKDDPLAAYDVDVRQEGLAIQEYLTLIQQQQQQQQQQPTKCQQ